MIKNNKTIIPTDYLNIPTEGVNEFLRIKKLINREETSIKKTQKFNKKQIKKEDNLIGTVVGEKALPISEDNKGHKMLLAMGWKKGEGLGIENSGSSSFIEVKVRSKRGGLGGE